jgi:putative ABC transport system ATP-binding protein
VPEPPLLVAEGLTRRFGGGAGRVVAVDGVDLTCAAGEIVLVMGPSGSGKTTLLTMLGALLRPTAGRVVIDGTEVTALRGAPLTAVRRRLVGFVFQSFNLIETLTAAENVQIAMDVAGVPGREARRRALELLARTGLADRAGLRTRDLSGGERQRVSVARALANRPPLVLADEPTANLDSAAGREVMGLLRDLVDAGGRGAVVVSHDARVEAVADRVLWMEDGRLTARPPAD